MKKDIVFTPVLLAIGVALFLFKTTGMIAHIVISVVGLAVLIAYSVLTKKEWKIPAVEIVARVCYALALVSGIVIKFVPSLVALAVVHKVTAALFVVLILALFVHKLIAAKKA